MRRMFALSSVFFLFAALACADERHDHKLSAEELGSIHFSTSCAKNVEATFNRAVALLHSFQYEQSRDVFVEVSKRDPACAMAQWGIAMSHYHGLWDNGDAAAGRAALLTAQELAGANPRTTARERAYISALEEIYRQDDKDSASHARAFEQKMGELQTAYP